MPINSLAYLDNRSAEGILFIEKACSFKAKYNHIIIIIIIIIIYFI